MSEEQPFIPRGPFVRMYFLRIIVLGFLRAVYLSILWPTTLFFFVTGVATFVRAESLKEVVEAFAFGIPSFVTLMPRRLSHSLLCRLLPFTILRRKPKYTRFILLLIMLIVLIVYANYVDREEIDVEIHAERDRFYKDDGRVKSPAKGFSTRVGELFERTSTRKRKKAFAEATSRLKEEDIAYCDLYLNHTYKARVQAILDIPDTLGKAVYTWSDDLEVKAPDIHEKKIPYQRKEMAKSPLNRAQYQVVLETVEKERLDAPCKKRRERQFNQNCFEESGKHVILERMLIDQLHAQGRRYQHVEASHSFFDAYGLVRHRFKYIYPGGAVSKTLYQVEAVVDTKTCEVMKQYPPQETTLVY